MILPTQAAYKLMHNGAKALARVETNGIRVDTDYLDKTIEKVGRRIDSQTEKLKQDDVYKTWRRAYGSRMLLSSRPQLGKILFDKMGYPGGKKLKKSKQYATDEETLGKLDIPFVKTYLGIEKLKKLRSTYLRGIRREVVDGILRPAYNLHLVRTYRSSSDTPNFQNIPIRDKTIGKLIRRAFVPREGRVLVEVDYGGIEVRVAACYHKDPTMLQYIEDGYDLHRDMAAECYMLSKEEVSKDVRFYAKNQFVFPEFYGSYFKDVGWNLWNVIRTGKLKTNDGVCLYEHLKSQGIERLGKRVSHWSTGRIETFAGDFLEHIRQVETRFWDERFPVYRDWKKDWVARYNRRGYFRSKTGFVFQGIYRRNEAINYAIQGSAFHCLLWSLIRLERLLRKKGFGSIIVGQIHDSLLLDVVKEELEDVIALTRQVSTEDLRKAWPWIITPLEIDVEGSDVNWHEKKELVV